ncbi:unnamed protein product [Diabrotica balteata]|uniref:Reverse transcriptase domain-containing protein n=1 Tax=Diabrotica balteata TaxID=107213 RepID=A0A9N9XD63_DIABA|nr:unnamed protein product [Diabrotica balteata]
MFKQMKRKHHMRININGEDLNHLRLADGVVLISDRFDKATKMLHTLYKVSKTIGLKINTSKTKFMTNLEVSGKILIESHSIDQIIAYKYLGHEIRSGRDNHTTKIQRRIGLTWAAFGRLNSIFKSSIPVFLKRKVFNQDVLPVLTYGAETLTLIKTTIDKIRLTQRAMERSIIGITIRDKVPNIEIRRRTGITDADEKIAMAKWACCQSNG